uniref:Uncharacterized protein n=1 Tax=Anguilla anguilla TaxID=7936 RepID=A0A0E9P9Y5_ANGAN
MKAISQIKCHVIYLTLNCMQRVCDKVINMTTFIYKTLICPKHYYVA